MKSKKSLKVLKLNKETITALSANNLQNVKGGFLSIGAQCSCDNSCDRDNHPAICCMSC